MQNLSSHAFRRYWLRPRTRQVALSTTRQAVSLYVCTVGTSSPKRVSAGRTMPYRTPYRTACKANCLIPAVPYGAVEYGSCNFHITAQPTNQIKPANHITASYYWCPPHQAHGAQTHAARAAAAGRHATQHIALDSAPRTPSAAPGAPCTLPLSPLPTSNKTPQPRPAPAVQPCRACCRTPGAAKNSQQLPAASLILRPAVPRYRRPVSAEVHASVNTARGLPCHEH